MLVDRDSLGVTIDRVNEVFFSGERIPDGDVEEAITWISSRFNKPRAYRGLFAPTQRDFEQGFMVFTGEKITSGAGTAHILSEEAGRALLLLDPGKRLGIHKAVRETLLGMLSGHDKPGAPWGSWCCGICSVSLWRHLASGGGDQQERRLANGLSKLTAVRDGKGRWKRYPFYYTILSLIEMEIPQAIDELRYAGSSIERAYARSRNDTCHNQRKRLVLEKALGKI